MKEVVTIFIMGLLMFNLMESDISNEATTEEVIVEEQVIIEEEVTDVSYPEKIGYDDNATKREMEENNPVSDEFLEAVNGFSAKTINKLVSETGGDNVIFSPISMYMALALSASGADGETRDELMSVLDMDEFDSDTMNEMTGNLFRVLYTDNEIGKLKMANSLWCKEGVSFNNDFINVANDDYYASVFSVDFTKDVTKKLISDWIAEQTNGTLEFNGQFDQNTMMILFNTIYFYDQWLDRFDEELTEKDIFYLYNGDEITSTFMNQTFSHHRFYEGDGYICSSLRFKNDCSMNFYLPDEDLTVYDLVSTPEKVENLLDLNGNSNERKYGKLIVQLPKFDYNSNINLTDTMKSMGMISALDREADFSNMLENNTLFISNIFQAAQISIDEIGCEASAFTQISFAGSAMPKDEGELILNRPFMYTITNDNGVALFVGVVNNPNDL